MQSETKINISLIVILTLLFTGMIFSTNDSVSIKIINVLFSLVMMIIYIEMADEKIKNQLKKFVSIQNIIAPILVLFFLLLLFTIFSALIGHWDINYVFIMFAYFLIPFLFVLMHRKEENTLSIWFFLAIVSVWYANDLHIVPDVSLPISGGVSVPKLMGIIWLMYLFLVYRELEGVGLTYQLKKTDVKTAAIYFGIFISFFALPIGVSTGFISSTKNVMAIYKWPVVAVAIMFFIAIIEEFLFRGLFLNLIKRTVHGKYSTWIALIISSILFGFAHADHHKFPEIMINLPLIGKFMFPWVYVLLATTAGVFYGLTYLKTGKITAAALTHCLVDTLWRIFLKG